MKLYGNKGKSLLIIDSADGIIPEKNKERSI